MNSDAGITANAVDVFNFDPSTNDRLTVSGSDVLLDNILVGTLSGTGTSQLSVDLSVDLTASELAVLAQAITYEIASEDPETAMRLAWSVSGTTASGVIDVAVTPVDDVPTVALTRVAREMESSGIDYEVFKSVTLSPIEAAQSISHLELEFRGIDTDELTNHLIIDGDLFSLDTDIAATPLASADFADVSFGYTIDAGVGRLSFSDIASTEQAEKLLEALRFRTTAAADNSTLSTTRDLRLVGVTDTGDVSKNTLSVSDDRYASSFTFPKVNNAPTLDAVGDNPRLVEGADPATLFSSASVTLGLDGSSTEDTDQTISDLELTVTNVSSGNFLSIDDTEVALTDDTSGTTIGGVEYTVTMTGSTATVALSGSLSATQTATLVQSLKFGATGDLDILDRVVTLTSIKDTGGTPFGSSDTTSLSLSSTVSLVSVDQAPSLDLTGEAVNFAAGATSGVTLFSEATVSAIETDQRIKTLVLRVDGETLTATETLKFWDTQVTFSNGQTDVASDAEVSVVTDRDGLEMTLAFDEPFRSMADVEALLKGLEYLDSNGAAASNTRTVTVTSISDTGDDTVPSENTSLFFANTTGSGELQYHAVVTIEARNQAPIVIAPSEPFQLASGSINVTGLRVVDVDDTSVSVVIETNQDNAGYLGTLTLSSTADGISLSNASGNGSGRIQINSVDLDKLNATLAGISYSARAGFDSSAGDYDAITLTATDDSGAVGAGIAAVVVAPATSWVIVEDTSQDIDLLIDGVFELGRMENGSFVPLTPNSSGNFETDFATISSRSVPFSDPNFSGLLSVSPNADAHGVEKLAYQVNGANPIEFDLHVLPVNDAPTIEGAASAFMWVLDSNPTSQILPFTDLTVDNIESGQTIDQVTFTLEGDASDVTLTLADQDISIVGGASGTIGDLDYTIELFAGSHTITVVGAWTLPEATSLIRTLGFATSNQEINQDYSLTLTSLRDSGGTALSGQDTADVVETADIRTMNEQVPSLSAATTATATEQVVSSNLLGDFNVDHDGLEWANDGAGDFSKSKLYVSFTDDASALDLFGLAFASTSSYSANTNDKTVTKAGAVIASYEDANGELAIAFGNSVSRNDVNAVARAVAFTADTDQPNTTAADVIRTVRATFTDVREMSASVDTAVTVVSVDDPGTIVSSGQSVTFTEGDSGVSLFSSTAIDLIEEYDRIASVQFKVTNVTDANDVLLLGNPAIGAQIAVDLSVSGTGTIEHDGQTLTFSVINSARTAFISVEAAAGESLTTASAQALIDTIKYQNTASRILNQDTRVISITAVSEISDPDGSAIVTEIAQSGIDANVTFDGSIERAVEGGPPVYIFANTAVSAVTAGATVTINSELTFSDGTSDTTTADHLYLAEYSSAPGDYEGVFGSETGDLEVGGTVVGSYAMTSDQNGATYTITANASMTADDMTALLQRLEYRFSAELLKDAGTGNRYSDLRGADPTTRFSITTNGVTLDSAASIDIPLVVSNDAPDVSVINPKYLRDFSSNQESSTVFFPNGSTVGNPHAIYHDDSEPGEKLFGVEVIVESFDASGGYVDFFDGELFRYRDTSYDMAEVGAPGDIVLIEELALGQIKITINDTSEVDLSELEYMSRHEIPDGILNSDLESNVGYRTFELVSVSDSNTYGLSDDQSFTAGEPKTLFATGEHKYTTLFGPQNTPPVVPFYDISGRNLIDLPDQNDSFQWTSHNTFQVSNQSEVGEIKQIELAFGGIQDGTKEFFVSPDMQGTKIPLVVGTIQSQLSSIMDSSTGQTTDYPLLYEVIEGDGGEVNLRISMDPADNSDRNLTDIWQDLVNEGGYENNDPIAPGAGDRTYRIDAITNTGGLIRGGADTLEVDPTEVVTIRIADTYDSPKLTGVGGSLELYREHAPQKLFNAVELINHNDTFDITEFTLSFAGEGFETGDHHELTLGRDTIQLTGDATGIPSGVSANWGVQSAIDLLAPGTLEGRSVFDRTPVASSYYTALRAVTNTWSSVSSDWATLSGSLLFIDKYAVLQAIGDSGASYITLDYNVAVSEDSALEADDPVLSGSIQFQNDQGQLKINSHFLNTKPNDFDPFGANDFTEFKTLSIQGSWSEPTFESLLAEMTYQNVSDDDANFELPSSGGNREFNIGLVGVKETKSDNTIVSGTVEGSASVKLIAGVPSDQVAPTWTATAVGAEVEAIGARTKLFSGVSIATSEYIDHNLPELGTMAGSVGGFDLMVSGASSSDILRIGGVALPLATSIGQEFSLNLDGVTVAVAQDNNGTLVLSVRGEMSADEAANLIEGMTYQNTTALPTTYISVTNMRDAEGDLSTGAFTAMLSPTTTSSAGSFSIAPVLAIEGVDQVSGNVGPFEQNGITINANQNQPFSNLSRLDPIDTGQVIEKISLTVSLAEASDLNRIVFSFQSATLEGFGVAGPDLVFGPQFQDGTEVDFGFSMGPTLAPLGSVKYVAAANGRPDYFAIEITSESVAGNVPDSATNAIVQELLASFTILTSDLTPNQDGTISSMATAPAGVITSIITQVVDSGGDTFPDENTTNLSIVGQITPDASTPAMNLAPTLEVVTKRAIQPSDRSAVTMFSDAVATAGGDTVGTLHAMLLLEVKGVTDAANEFITIDGQEYSLQQADHPSGVSVSEANGVTTVQIGFADPLNDAELAQVVNGLAYRNTNVFSDDEMRIVEIIGLMDNAADMVAQTGIAMMSHTAIVAKTGPVENAPTLTATSTNPKQSDPSQAVAMFAYSDVNVMDPSQQVAGLSFKILDVDVLNDEISFTLPFDGIPATTVPLTNGAELSMMTAPDAPPVVYGTVSITDGDAIVALDLAALGQDFTEVLASKLVDSIQLKTATLGMGEYRDVVLSRIVDSGATTNTSNIEVVSRLYYADADPQPSPPSLVATGASTLLNSGVADVTLFTDVSISSNDPGQKIERIVLEVGGVEDLGNEGIGLTLPDGTENTVLLNGSLGSIVSTRQIGLETVRVSLDFADGVTASQAKSVVESLKLRSQDPLSQTHTVTITDVYDTGSTASHTALSGISATISVAGAQAPDITIGANDTDIAALPETDTGLNFEGSLTVSDLNGDDLTTTIRGLTFSGDYQSDQLSYADARAMLTLSSGATLDLDENTTSGTIVYGFDSGSEAFDFLAEGETLIIDYHLRSSDGALTDDHVVRIQIEGQNDQLTANNSAFSINVRDGVLSYNLLEQASPTDVDATDTFALLGAPVVAAKDAQGNPAIVPADAWVFTDASGTFELTPAALNLANGETLSLTINYKVTDGTTPVDVETKIDVSYARPAFFDITAERNTVETAGGTVVMGQLGAMDVNGNILSAQPDLSWKDLDGEEIRFGFDQTSSDLIFGRLNLTNARWVEATSATGAILKLNTQTGQYLYSSGSNPAYVEEFQIYVSDGSEMDHLWLIFSDGDMDDRDGVSATVEQALAEIAAIGSADDGTKHEVATLAWRSREKFVDSSGLQSATDEGANDFADAVVRIETRTSDGQQNAFVQIGGLEVLSTDDSDASEDYFVEAPDELAGETSDPSLKRVVTTAWDPIKYNLEALTSLGFDDIDDQRTGTQVKVYIDLSSAGLTRETANSYMKYISQDVIDAYATASLPLQDLDGAVIGTSGWYDFTAKTDEDGNRISDGALFVYDGSNPDDITGMEIVFTDNAFGDNSTTVDRILDPGTIGHTKEVFAFDNEEAETEDNTAIEGNVLTDGWDDPDDDLDNTELEDYNSGAGNLSVIGYVLGASSDPADMTAMSSEATINTGYGDLVLGTDGTYSLTLGPAAQTLNMGDAEVVTLSYQITNGTQTDIAQLRLTITGENDAPTVTADIGSTTESSTVTIDVTANDPDVDNTDAELAITKIAGTLVSNGDWVNLSAGRVQLIDGKLVFDTNGAFENLDDGDTLNVDFGYTLSDGSAETQGIVTITVTGQNDAPTLIFSRTQETADEDAGSFVVGSVAGTDVDADDMLNYALLSQPSKGTVTDIDQTTGQFSFLLGDDFQYLAVSEQVTVSFDVLVTDSHAATAAQTVSLTITGVNDGPGLTAIDVEETLSETNAILTTSGSLTLSDVDLTDEVDLSTALTVNGELGGATADEAKQWLAVTGGLDATETSGTVNWTFTGPTFDYLSAGEVLTLEYALTAQDGQGGTATETVTIIVSGTNDVSIISGDLTGSELEADIGDTSSTTGTLQLDDPDGSEPDTFLAETVTGVYGVLTIDAAGAWTYTLDQASVQSFNTGDEVTDPILVTTVGGSTATITMTISGSNDGPDMSAPNLDVVEDRNAFATVDLTDVDDVSERQISDNTVENRVLIAPSLGRLTLDRLSGVYSYDPLSHFADLVEGDTQMVSFVTGALNQTSVGGGVALSAVYLQITGANEAPSVTEITDLSSIPASEVITFELSHAPAEGSITQDSETGAYLFNQGADFDDLAIGESRATSFELKIVRDGTSLQTLAVEQTVYRGDVVADQNALDGAYLTAVDGANPYMEDTVTHTYTISSQPTKGTVEIDPETGDYSFFTGDDFDYLKEGDTTTVTFEILAYDTQFAGVRQTVTVTVTGTNDGPEIAVSDMVATEDGASVTGSPDVTDPDVGDTHVFTVGAVPSGRGSVSIDAATGAYTFDPGSDFQSLAVGETTTVSFDVTATDMAGKASTETVVMTVTGTNDAPDVATTNLSALEDGNTVSGTATTTDVDATNTHAFSVSGLGTGQGLVTIDTETGQYTFDPHTDFQALKAGEEATVSFAVTATDSNGGTGTQTVAVTVTGANDAPTLTVSNLTTTEDATAQGTAASTDVDNDATRSFSVVSAPDGQGSLSINATTGVYTFDPLDDFQDLTSDTSRTVTFDVIVTDELGATTVQTVSILVNGLNDAPTVVAADLTATEDGAAVSGIAAVSDVDTDDSKTFSVTELSAGQGSVEIDPTTGVYTFEPGVDFQSLGAGEQGTVTFDVIATDSAGAIGSKTVTVTITGTNDAPVLTVADLSADEDGGIVTGAPFSTDVDDTNNERRYSVTPLAAGEGTVAINPTTGQLSFDPGDDFQSLAEGQTTTVSFDVTVTDDQGALDIKTVTVTVTGVNDAASASAQTQDVIEDGAALTAAVVGSDLDSDLDPNGYTLVSDVSEGALTFNTDGTYVFDPVDDFQDLNAGQTRDLSFTFVAKDYEGASSAPATVTITVTGVDDLATLTGSTASLIEDGEILTASGQVLLSDADAVDAVIVAQAETAGTYGDFSISASGAWTYVTRDAVSALADGEVVSETFVVAANDDETTEVVISITGTTSVGMNIPTVELVESDAILTATGQATVTGSDAGFVARTDMPGTYGTLSIDPAGNWSYATNSALNELNAGQSVQDELTLTLDDGSTSVLRVNILGTEDVATVEDVSYDLIETDAVLTAAGRLIVADLDATDATVVAQSDQAGSYGVFSVNSAGAWSYTTNDALNALASEGIAEDVFEVATRDRGVGSVTVRITGSNDAPILSVSNLSAAEDGDPISDTATSSDLDTDDTRTFSVSQPALGRGNVSINETSGVYTFDPSVGFQHLGVGETETVTFSVTVMDGQGATDARDVTVTVVGTNDVPVVADLLINAVEDGAAVSGSLEATDADGDLKADGFVLQTNVVEGVLTLNADGSFSFDPGASFQDLNAGVTRDVSFSYSASDDAGTTSVPATVTIRVTGVEDITQSDSPTRVLTETDDVLNASGTLTLSDPDAIDATVIAQENIATDYGVFNIDAVGAWTYVTNTALNHLDPGLRVTDSLDVATSDGGTATITIHIDGTEDVATLTSQVTTIDETDAAQTITGTVPLDDLDSTATSFVAQSNQMGSYGTFEIDASGAWIYVMSGAFDALDPGDVVEDSFDVATLDGGTATVKIVLNGTQDVASLTSDTRTLTETDAVQTTSGTLVLTDRDAQDAIVVAQNGAQGALGDFSIDASGAWTYRLNSAADYLDEGENVTETFSVETSDGGTATVAITVAGTQDVSSLASATENLVETDAAQTVTGQLVVADADATAATIVPQTNQAGAYGTFAIDASGAWGYTMNSAANELDTGAAVSDVFDIVTTDGATATVTIGITGTQDAATLSSATETIVENDAIQSASGTLLITDLDTTDATIIAQSDSSGALGVFSIDTSGEWTYTLSAAADHLNAGQTALETFNVATSDGGAAYVNVTVTGTEDVATLSAATVDLTETDSTQSISGTLLLTDPDAVDATVVPVNNVAGAYGTFSINLAGDWVYQMNSAADALNDAQTVTEVFDVATSDGGASTVTVRLTGTNDLASLSAATAQITESNATQSVTGRLEVTDLDAVGAAIVPQTATSDAYGVFDIGTNGIWAYQMTTAADQLNMGDTVTERFTVSLDDGTTNTVTIEITGTNDVATVTSVVETLTETDVAQSLSGRVVLDDLDAQDAVFVPAVQAGALGAFSVDAAGDWVYQMTTAADHLDGGDQVTETFTVNTSDGGAGHVEITINGTDDLPVLSAPQQGAVAEGDEGDHVTVSGQAIITDADEDDTGAFVSETLQGSYGVLQVETNGQWEFTLDQSAVQYLATGESVQETLQLTTLSGENVPVEITVHGSNDLEALDDVTATVAVFEDPINVDLADVFEDLDISDTHVLTPGTPSLVDQDGNVVTERGLALDGTILRVDPTAFTPMASTDVITIRYPVTIDDGQQTITATSTITVTGGFAPVLRVDAHGTDVATVTETDAAVSASGTLTLYDPELADSATVSVTQVSRSGSAADLSGYDFLSYLTVSGALAENATEAAINWTFDAPSVDELALGETLTLTYTVTAVDSTGQSGTKIITIHVVGTNDAPVARDWPMEPEPDFAPSTRDNYVIASEDQWYEGIAPLGNDTDIDDSDLTLVSASAAYGSVIVQSDRTIDYLSDANYHGPDLITYTIEDGHGAQSSASIFVVVLPANDAPELSTPPANVDFVEGQGEGTHQIADHRWVKLAGTLDISDLEIDARVQAGSGDYSGVSVEIASLSNPNSFDSFRLNVADYDVHNDQLVRWTDQAQGAFTALANITQSDGSISLAFDVDGVAMSRSFVQTVLNAVEYRNTSQDPDAAVDIRWSFYDGNTGINDQGTGGTLSDVETQRVMLRAVNDAPELLTDIHAQSAPVQFVEDITTSIAPFRNVSFHTVEAGQRIEQITLEISGLVDLEAPNGTGDLVEKIQISGREVELSTGQHTYIDFGATVTELGHGEFRIQLSIPGDFGTAAAAGLLEGLRYQNTSPLPTVGTRVFKIVEIKDDGGVDTQTDMYGTTYQGVDTTQFTDLVSYVDVQPRNSAPNQTSWGRPTYVVGPTELEPVEIGRDTTLSDEELDWLAEGYGGVSIQVARLSGANPSDQFALGALPDGWRMSTLGTVLMVGGEQVATVADSDGRLEISLGTTANYTVERHHVEQLIEGLVYLPSGTATTGTATFAVSVFDGNDTTGLGRQGYGGTLESVQLFDIEFQPSPTVSNNDVSTPVPRARDAQIAVPAPNIPMDQKGGVQLHRTSVVLPKMSVSIVQVEITADAVLETDGLATIMMERVVRNPEMIVIKITDTLPGRYYTISDTKGELLPADIVRVDALTGELRILDADRMPSEVLLHADDLNRQRETVLLQVELGEASNGNTAQSERQNVSVSEFINRLNDDFGPVGGDLQMTGQDIELPGEDITYGVNLLNAMEQVLAAEVAD